MSSPFRDLPAVSELLAALTEGSHASRLAAARAALDAARAAIRAGSPPPPLAELIADAARRLTEAARPHLRRVLNATGIVLHTNLGRAPLPPEAAEAVAAAAQGYCNLELDLATGERASRPRLVRDLICAVTGAAAATVVNNCAAATVVTLRALAAGHEVIVSRGQLVEIGGSFRIPEILAASGATLREVGTTNITRAADYAAAIGPQTAILMRVHQSNYRIRGFTSAPSIGELATLGRERGIIVVDDIGSGALVDYARFGLPGEPIASESLTAGADLVLFSADKLLGGPQAGIIAGRADLIARVERDPFARAVRCDKLALAALEATLRLYLDPATVTERVPVLRMLARSVAELRVQAERIADGLRDLPLSVTLIEDVAYSGGGSLPDVELPTVCVELRAEAMSEDELARRLRHGNPAVLARCQNGALRIDPRALDFNDEAPLIAAVRTALA